MGLDEESFGMQKKSADSLSCRSAGFMPAEWNQICSLPCPTTSMVDSDGHVAWNQTTRTHNLCSSSIGETVPVLWTPSNGGTLLSTGPEMLPIRPSHFPNETGITDRAARFSYFSDAVYPFTVPSTSNAIAGAQMQKDEAGGIEVRNSRSALIDTSSNNGCSTRQQEKRANEFLEQELSADAQEESPNSSKVVLERIKRKRSHQVTEPDQGQTFMQLPFEHAKNASDNNQKAVNSSSSMAAIKSSKTNSKESTEAHKEDYIHVRARRGQATNSHSLAERVRREKISERMKFLQDLVPGCSKVTGKAVMLDEIINYVQSLQRQVEFLSMKLAAVNPSIDLNIEGLLFKDLFQTCNVSSPAIGFTPEMIHQPLSHQGMIQGGIPGVMNPSDAFRRGLIVHLPSISGYKESAQQLPNAWDEDLQNFVQMTYGNNSPLKTRDLNGASSDGFPL